MTIPLLESASSRFGRLLRMREAGAFQVRLTRFEPDQPFPLHRHPLAYFCYVVRGGLDEHCSGAEQRFSAGSVHFHPEGEPHRGCTGPRGLESLSIVPLGAHAERAGRLERAARDAAVPRLSPEAARCYAAFLATDSASDLALEAAALELLAGTLRAEARPRGAAPSWVSRVRDHLHERFADRVALDELAAVAGVHPVHVVRGFRRHAGVTPGAYQRRLRLDWARRSLLETDLPIVEIALRAGFSHQSHFTRAFQRHTGLPPSAFRRLHFSSKH